MHNGEASFRHSDTSPEVDRRRLELLASKSDTERAAAAFALTEQVRKMVWAAVRRSFPDADEAELRVRYAEHVYGPDIAARVRKWTR